MSLFKVLIERPQVDAVRARTIGTTGEVVHLQKIWLFRHGSRFPTEFEIRLPSGFKLYPAGDYVLDAQAVFVPDKYGALSVNPFAAVTLVPVAADFMALFDTLNHQLYQALYHPHAAPLPADPAQPEPPAADTNAAPAAPAPLFKTGKSG